MKSIARVPLMIISFLISLTLWLYVQTQEDPISGVSATFAVPIEVENLPGDYMVISKPPIYTFSPIGSDEERRKIRPTDLHAVVDLSQPKIGSSDYQLILKSDRPYNVTWNPSAARISITVDKNVQNVQKSIQVRHSGQLPETEFEYVPEQTTVTPPFVYVSGPRMLVDKVDHAEAVLDLSQVRPGEKQGYDSPIQLFTKDGIILSDESLRFNPGPVMVTPGLRLASEVRPFIITAIFKGSVAFGYQVKRTECIPTQIELTGKTGNLNSISRLETEPVDLTGLTQTSTIRAKVIIPTNIEKAEPRFVDVKIVIEPSPKRPGL